MILDLNNNTNTIRRAQLCVLEFRRAFDQPSNLSPIVPTSDTSKLDVTLMTEELDELVGAMLMKDMVGVADGIADLLYVVLGTAISYGINIEPIFNEVHRSNMTKEGGHKREDGKWIKPSTYEPAKLEPILRAQGWEG